MKPTCPKLGWSTTEPEFEWKLVTEGLAKLRVPEVPVRSGPGSKTGPVFYNPRMQFGRDASVMVLRGFSCMRSSKHPPRVLDGLCGTGVRGIRYRLETDAPIEVELNDASRVACRAARTNIRMNHLARKVEIHNQPVNSLLARTGYDFIDIDPYGSAVPHLLAAIQACQRGGIVAVTATDTAPLCGTYPKTCLRRYGAVPSNEFFMHESAVRILAGFCVRTGAQCDRAVTPVLSISADHYIRLFLRVEYGASKTDVALAGLGYAAFDKTTGSWDLGASPGPRTLDPGPLAGPMWLGPLHDAEVLDRLQVCDWMGTAKRLEKMLAIWRDEAGMPPMFHSTDELSSKLKVPPPKVESVIGALRNLGRKASRTQFLPSGFKTDASQAEVVRVIRVPDISLASPLSSTVSKY